MPDCFNCQAYANVVTNARQKLRKRGSTGVERLVTFTREEFLAWVADHPRQCRYCNISDAEYWALDLRSANGTRLEALGLDRLGNDEDYDLANIAWCCYPCNRAKGNVFTEAEMAPIGQAIERVWRVRLAEVLTADGMPTSLGAVRPAA